MFNKKYKFKAGDIVRQKVTGWKVILLVKNWVIDQDNIGEWEGKIWVVSKDGTGYWSKEYFFESELES